MEAIVGAVVRIAAKGGEFIIDASDSQAVLRYRWSLCKSKSGRLYVRRNRMSLARFLMKAPKGMHVDHINGNTLDNRRCNLRICTHSENQWNRKRGHGAIRFKGVALLGDKRAVSKWRATVQRHGRRYTIGTFKTALAAALAYDDAAVLLFGEFASPNFPERIRLLQSK